MTTTYYGLSGTHTYEVLKKVVFLTTKENLCRDNSAIISRNSKKAKKKY